MLRLVTLVIFLLPLSCGRYSLRLVGRTPTSIHLQFPDTGGGLLMYVESELAQASDPPWESLLVLEGNHEVTLTGLQPNTSYRLIYPWLALHFPANCALLPTGTARFLLDFRLFDQLLKFGLYDHVNGTRF